jgi:hypothetical protein
VATRFWRREAGGSVGVRGRLFALLGAGIPVDRNASWWPRLGWFGQAGWDMMLGVAYQGQIGSRAQKHGLEGNFTWRF